MSNIYIGYHFEISPLELGSEILIAELGEKAFESFIETTVSKGRFSNASEVVRAGLRLLRRDGDAALRQAVARQPVQVQRAVPGRQEIQRVHVRQPEHR